MLFIRGPYIHLVEPEFDTKVPDGQDRTNFDLSISERSEQSRKVLHALAALKDRETIFVAKIGLEPAFRNAACHFGVTRFFRGIQVRFIHELEFG